MAIPMLVMAGLAAAAAAAQGIGGAVQAGEQAKMTAAEQAKNRELQERLAREQAAEQQRQFTLQKNDAVHGALQGQLAAGAEQTTQLSAERAATRDDMKSALARAYLGKR